jgi:Bacterial membrane protein YfhO
LQLPRRKQPVLLLALIIVIFNWRTLLTRQFSLLSEAEGVNQGYSWLVFSIDRIRHGQLPGWDPFTFGGRSFIGEMQTSGLSPFNLLLALVPSNRNGLPYPYTYNAYIAVLYFLAAWFMYKLARELRLSEFASLLAGVCFSCGGFVSRPGWPDMIQSSIWLPLIFLFLLRALASVNVNRRQALLNAAFSGLALGLSILGGRLHIAMMQAIVVVTAAAYYAWPQRGGEPRGQDSVRWRSAFAIVCITGLFAFGVGAVQLLPSMEYSPKVIRAIGATAIAAESAIPYKYLGDNILSPHGILTLLVPFAFNGDSGAGERVSPYMGVFPLLLVIIGIARNWSNRWVRYFSFLALLSLLYAMGPFSGLHGFLYALVPRLWMLREAPRLLYLTSFGMALMAGFGVDSLLAGAADSDAWRGINRVFTAVAAIFAIALAIPMVYGKPEVNNWISLSVLLVFLSYALFRYIIAGHKSGAGRFLIVALILVDLSPFDWTAKNKTELEHTGGDYLRKLTSCSGAVRFLKSQPGVFRVKVEGPEPPNIGDAYGVYTMDGMGATGVYNFGRINNRLDLYNVEYLMKPASATDPSPVYSDPYWKIYRNENVFQHAWVVHRVKLEPSREDIFLEVASFKGDMRETALIGQPLNEDLDPPSGASEMANVTRYGLDRMEVSVESRGRGLLVLSENYYPGWRAFVNGKPASIYEVNGALRGVVVPDGQNTVTLRYAPWSLRLGVVLSIFTLLFIPCTVLLTRRFGRRQPELARAGRRTDD